MVPRPGHAAGRYYGRRLHYHGGADLPECLVMSGEAERNRAVHLAVRLTADPHAPGGGGL